jgi:ribosomal-protein-serine acetyltransferase
VKPILRDFPEEFETERLTIRAPRFGDSLEVRAAILESLDSLGPWLPWVHPVPTLEEEEALLREGRVSFMARRDLWLLLFLKGTNTFAGASGLHVLDWDVPSFEIGYWVRKKFEGQGYISEAVVGITQFAFEVLDARRVEIHVDDRNFRSWRIPERLGFTLEGILHNNARDVDGKLFNTRIYAKVRADDDIT